MTATARPLRLCLIGNSHLGALQAALRKAPDRWPGLRCEFHGFRGTTVRDTDIAGGVMHPTAPEARDQMIRFGGADRIDLNAHDAIVVVGFNIKVQHALSLWKEARWPWLATLAEAEDLADLPQTLISRRAARAALAGYLASLTGFEMAARIRAAVDRPVALIGHPRLHRRVKWEPMGRFFGIGRAIGKGDGAEVSALFEEAAQSAAAQARITHLPQPRRTIFEDLLTDPRYMAGRIEVNDPAGGRKVRPDHSHPNGAYGALMLDRLQQVAA